MIYTCCDELRRNAVDEHPTLNGIDYLEVLDQGAPPRSLRQRTLLVHLLKAVPELARENVRIEGGERVRGIGIEWVAPASNPPPALVSVNEQSYFTELAEADHVLLVRTDVYGDFSTYMLRLVRTANDDRPPEGFDPRLSAIAFSFKVECQSDFDCVPVKTCPEDLRSEPDIDYLAKDYASFRRLVLDRLTRLVPGWRERSAADQAVALAELIAYAGDHLSYQQDAVATEAYLDTARRRTSLRRHALLVDYHMHDGCNARTWMHVRVGGEEPVPLPQDGTRFYTHLPGLPRRISPGSREDEQALGHGPEVFEPLHEALLFEAHNTMHFYTWGDTRCCLPRGATRATLRDHLEEPLRLRLRPGDVLIFEEVQGPHTGLEGDANPAHRHAIRLTRVQPEAVPEMQDEREIDRTPGSMVTDPLNDRPIVEIEWAADDALPFPLCISSQTDEAHGSNFIEEVSLALGNIVLADHGRTIENEPLGTVPKPWLYYPPDRDSDRCAGAEPIPVPPRFRPKLVEKPLTQAATVERAVVIDGERRTERVPFEPEAPASQAFRWDMRDVVPRVLRLEETLDETADGSTVDWEPKRDLLNSDRSATEFVVEAEHDGVAYLRFGDDRHGKRPDAASAFTATYRVGNGLAGNVGADALAHVVAADARISGARNPLAASGGIEPESPAEVRRRAPQAFRTQERAVTPEDYAAVTERHAAVQRAAAQPRWTGSWNTVFITVDRVGGRPLDDEFETALALHVERYRMAGHDIAFDDAIYVPLEIGMLVCVKPEYFRSDVLAGLLEVFSNRDLPDGRRGVFHPDHLTFGQTVYLSPLYAAARGVPGVASVQIRKFQRQGTDDGRFLADGYMKLGRLEIARLDNDPNFPEHGLLRVALGGGK